MTPTAMSTTLPFMANSLNSDPMLMDLPPGMLLVVGSGIAA
jgi:hypothetical protein